MNFGFRFEAFQDNSYSKAVNVGKGTTQENIFRGILTEDTSTNTWTYTTFLKTSGVCEVFSGPVTAPCGTDVFSTSGENGIMLEINVRANTSAGLQRADQIIREMGTSKVN
jgi:hypothetical protein